MLYLHVIQKISSNDDSSLNVELVFSLSLYSFSIFSDKWKSRQKKRSRHEQRPYWGNESSFFSLLSFSISFLPLLHRLLHDLRTSPKFYIPSTPLYNYFRPRVCVCVCTYVCLTWPFDFRVSAASLKTNLLLISFFSLFCRPVIATMPSWK